MPLESASYLHQLDATNPTGDDPVAQADDHIRMVKQAAKATFPNITGIVTASHTDLNTRLVPTPAGGGVFIAMWSGIVSSIPTGWQLCDGTNGTPNLRDRFIVGAGTTYAPSATGGAVTATTSAAGAHTPSMNAAGTHSHGGATQSHVLTEAEIPSHHHITSWGESNSAEASFGVAGGVGYAGSGQTDHDNYQFNTSNTGGGSGHTHGLTADGSHTHTMNGVADHTHTVDTRSPYYALCFIAKV